jgi:hypothetical protein
MTRRFLGTVIASAVSVTTAVFCNSRVPPKPEVEGDLYEVNGQSTFPVYAISGGLQDRIVAYEFSADHKKIRAREVVQADNERGFDLLGKGPWIDSGSGMDMGLPKWERNG